VTDSANKQQLSLSIRYVARTNINCCKSFVKNHLVNYSLSIKLVDCSASMYFTALVKYFEYIVSNRSEWSRDAVLDAVFLSKVFLEFCHCTLCCRMILIIY